MKKKKIKELKDKAKEEIRLLEPNVEKIMHEYKQEFQKFQMEFIDRVIILSIVGFGLITSLAWDDALKSILDYFFKELTEVQEKILYALILTIITATATVIFNRFLQKKENKRKTQGKK